MSTSVGRSSGEELGVDEAEDLGEACSKCDVVMLAKRFERCNLPVRDDDCGCEITCWIGWMIAIRSFDSGAAGRLQRLPEHILLIIVEKNE